MLFNHQMEELRHFSLYLFCRCTYFFLYDGSKVQGEGDPTREGICYFYPEEVRQVWLYCGLEFVCLFCIICVYFCQTPLDRQELLCGQLAGVSRCVSELSLSPVRILRLHRNKFAIRMRDDFFWVSEHSGGPAANFEYVYDFILFLNMSL